MINSVSVVNFRGDTLNMELRNPEKSGFLIQDIDGITPGDADISLTELSSTDGSIYNSARMPNRVISITIAPLISSKDSIETLRQRLYRYFPLKNKVTLTFYTDNRTSQISGYVESNSADIFSENETITVSINCPSPFFRKPTNSIVELSNIENLFEFVYENPDFSYETNSDKNTLFGEFRDREENIIVYDGDHDTGIEVMIDITEDPGTFLESDRLTLYNETHGVDKYFSIDVSYLMDAIGRELQAGDKIVINTKTGAKNAYVVLNNGSIVNILNCVALDSDWFGLVFGENRFSFRFGNFVDKFFNMSINYDVLYLGV